MHIGSTGSYNHLTQIKPATATIPQTGFDPEAEKTAGPNRRPVKILTAEQIAKKYDLSNITPREVDSMAEELSEGGHISTAEKMMLLTRGEEFLSHMPGNFYDEARVTAPINLINQVTDSIAMSKAHGGATEGSELLLEMLNRMHELGRASNEPGKSVV